MQRFTPPLPSGALEMTTDERQRYVDRHTIVAERIDMIDHPFTRFRSLVGALLPHCACNVSANVGSGWSICFSVSTEVWYPPVWYGDASESQSHSLVGSVWLPVEVVDFQCTDWLFGLYLWNSASGKRVRLINGDEGLSFESATQSLTKGFFEELCRQTMRKQTEVISHFAWTHRKSRESGEVA